MTYATHIMKHLRGILETAHGFKDYYRFQRITATADGVEAILRDTTEGVDYRVLVQPIRPEPTDPEFLTEPF